MKGLSLTQPWATLVAIGGKRVETRSWSSSYRGPIAIHAAKSFPMWARATCFEEPFARVLAAAGMRTLGDLPCGFIIATAKLIDCIPTHIITLPPLPGIKFPFPQVVPGSAEHEFGDYGDGRWAWILDDVKKLSTPIPFKGALGLWHMPDDIVARYA